MKKDSCEELMCECNVIHEDAVAAARKTMLTGEELTALSDIFRVLSDPTRMKLLWALHQQEMCVCDLAATLEMTKSAISHQLKTMKEFHVVKARRDGKNVFYSLDDDHVTEMIDLAKIHLSHTHKA